MKASSKSYPYPVLGNGDDVVTGSFHVGNFTYELGADNVVLRYQLVLENEIIAKLIENKQASFVVEVECGNTFFRKSFSTRNIEGEPILIPTALLRESVTVGFFICADAKLDSYLPSGCHPDYEGAQFFIEEGDILAIGGYSSFIAEKAFDPLRPPVSSFMSIMEGNDFFVPAEVRLFTEKITIVLSKNDWKWYLKTHTNKSAVGLLHASIVFPALVVAIQEVQNENSQYAEYNWYQRLRLILQAKLLSKSAPFYAAQSIIDNPLTRGFQEIELLTSLPGIDENE